MSPKDYYNHETFMHKVPIKQIPDEKRFIANDDLGNLMYIFHIDELYEYFKSVGAWLNPYTNKSFEERDQLTLRGNKKFEELFFNQQNETPKN
jgi:hypothetical protein